MDKLYKSKLLSHTDEKTMNSNNPSDTQKRKSISISFFQTYFIEHLEFSHVKAEMSKSHVINLQNKVIILKKKKKRKFSKPNGEGSLTIGVSSCLETLSLNLLSPNFCQTVYFP